MGNLESQKGVPPGPDDSDPQDPFMERVPSEGLTPEEALIASQEQKAAEPYDEAVAIGPEPSEGMTEAEQRALADRLSKLAPQMPEWKLRKLKKEGRRGNEDPHRAA